MPWSDERDQLMMGLALEQAQKAQDQGEVPIGAVIASLDEVIATGFNQPCLSHDPTAHAEIIALRAACLHQKNYRLGKELTLYVTLEPCIMCAGALLHARIGRLVFGAADSRPQSIHRQMNVFQSPAFNHQIEVRSGVRAEEATELLDNFFASRR